jgi:hypothetical protein
LNLRPLRSGARRAPCADWFNAPCQPSTGAGHQRQRVRGLRLDVTGSPSSPREQSSDFTSLPRWSRPSEHRMSWHHHRVGWNVSAVVGRPGEHRRVSSGRVWRGDGRELVWRPRGRRPGIPPRPTCLDCQPFRCICSLSSNAVWLDRVSTITGGFQLLFSCTLAGVGSSSLDGVLSGSDWCHAEHGAACQ